MPAWPCRALAPCLVLLCTGAARAEVAPRPVLRVITGHAAPFVQLPGTPVSGFSIEVWQEVARRLGVETDWTVLPRLFGRVALEPMKRFSLTASMTWLGPAAAMVSGGVSPWLES